MQYPTRALSALVLYLMLCLLLCTGAALAAQGKSAAYVGNPKSGIYHNNTCKYYNCKACTVPLATPQEAKAKGFRACKICRG